jgi:hypothetical protein
MNLTLTLSLEDTNKVMQALAAQPYAAVAELISLIQKQAQEQLNAPKPEPADVV